MSEDEKDKMEKLEAENKELREAMAYGIIAPSGCAKNFVKRMQPELDGEE